MKRYNTFYLIHKALRAMLYETALTLQQTDFSNYTEARAALAKINDVLFAFDTHAHHEDSFIIPAVETYEPGLAASFEKEHVEDLRISNRLKNIIVIYENIFFPEERALCGSALVKSFTEFVVFNLEHMAKEEQLLNQVLWEHYSDEQIIAIQQQLMATIPEEQLQQTSRWMMRSISNEDIANWIKHVKATGPEFAFNNLVSIAQEELSEIRFATILEILEEEELITV